MRRALDRRVLLVASLAAAFALAQCRAAGPDPAAQARSAAAWATVYEVLQHPRCVNCHPAGDVPLVGEHREVHPQNVQSGGNGMGLFAMACPTCHRDENTPGRHMPPGAPRWHMPPRNTPLVFEGRGARELARQLADPSQNGNLTPQQLLAHVKSDPLVLWGWNPGEGRAPVPVPHRTFVAAFQDWVEGGCRVPE